MIAQDLFKIISDLISFKTVFPNEKEFFNCITYIKNHFKNTNLHVEEFEFNNSNSLVISNSKTKQFDLIFCGHIDVVPASEDLFTVKKDGDLLYGRGVCDMKGQVAVMMQIIRELSQENSKLKVALFLTSDEERGGFDGVKKLLNELDYSSNVAIVPDGGFNYSLVSEAKGVLQIKVSTVGTESHASEPWNGINAISKLLEIFKQIVSEFPNPKNHLDWKTSFNIAKIEGGDSINKVPNKATMHIDIRHTCADTSENIINYIQNIDNSVNIEILAQGEAFKLDENNIYVKKYINTCQPLINKNVDIIKCHSASDGRFFSKKNIPCLIMNPIGGNLHGDNEWVSLESLNTLKNVYKNYLQELPIKNIK